VNSPYFSGANEGKYMKNKYFIFLLILMLFSLPVLASADVYSKTTSEELNCPAGERILFSEPVFSQRVEYGFDNFTITNFNMLITANTLLHVRISEITSLLTLKDVYVGDGFSFIFNVSDLFKNITYISQTNVYICSNQTGDFTENVYYARVPYFLIEIENIGIIDAIITFSYYLEIETSGYWEAEITVDKRDGIAYIPDPTNTNKIEDLKEKLFNLFPTALVGMFVLGFLFCAVAGDKFNIW